VSHNVFANNMEISSKASSGKTICNTPDVCFTPPMTPATPPGVPIPYPNTGMASDTADGSTTVKIANEEVMLKNKSNFSKSSGDEAGSAPKKGVVTSKNMGKVYFNAWSMDVKFEGENVPRNLDITTNNHMSKMPGNTPPMPHVSSMAMGMGAPKCEACAAAAKAGNPVNPLRGNKLLDGPDDLDFVLEGPLDLVWQRFYTSNLARVGFFGQGWMTPVEMHLLVDHRSVIFVDREGRSLPFPAMEVGETYFHRQDMCTLARVTADTFRLEQSDGLVLTFSAPPQQDSAARLAPLVRMSDLNENTIILTWDKQDTLLRVDGSGEHALLFEWSLERLSRVLRVRKGTPASAVASTQGDPLSRVVAAYEYTDGDLVAVTTTGGRRTREFSWTNHLMVRHAQPGGLQCFYEWTQHASEGKVLRSWTNTGSELRFDYRLQETIVTDQDGVTEVYSADRDGHLIGYVDGKGRQYRRVLDDDGHLVGTVTPTGVATRTELDDRGLPVRSWDEALAVTETEWHPVLFLATAEIDPLGRTERFSYDARGNLLTHVLGDGATTQYEYDGRGLLRAITDSLGKRRSREYDQAGRITQATDCTGSTERFEYDQHGQLISQVDALGNTTRYAYSPEGDLIAITAPDGATLRYEYDSLGRLIGEVEPMGGRTTFQLRPDGMLAAAIEADGQVTRYTRDGIGRLLQIENPNGAIFSLEYDRAGSIVRMKTFEGVEHFFGYSEDDILGWSEERARTGEVIRTTYGYDPVGRPTRVATSDGQWAEFEYDAAGQLIAGRNRLSMVSFKYDAAGRRIQEALRRLDVSQASATSPRRPVTGFQCAYDPNGNVIHTQIPGVTELTFLRYGCGYVHQIAVGGSPYCDIERDAAHLPRALTQKQLTTKLRYDEARQLTGVDVLPAAPVGTSGTDAPPILSSFRYDLNGDLVTVERSAPWEREFRTFRYDASRHVVDEGGTHRPATGIHWDGASNPVNAPGENVADNMVRSFGSMSANYDGFGRMNSRTSPAGDVHLEWNDLHQLVGARAQWNGVSSVEQYTYDAFGRRIAKITNGRETTFLWEGERLLMEEDDDARRVFVYHDRSHEPIGFALSPVLGTDALPPEPAHRFLYLHNDPPGSPFALTDEEGSVLWHARLAAFGPVTDVETGAQGEDGGTPDSSRSGFQPLRLQGQYSDSATGLWYNRFRYYDPLIGRFISPDPIGLLGGENTYRYAPNVFSWLDPFGLNVNQNRIDGARREKTEAISIVRKGKGQVRVERECYLRDCTTGKRVKDDDPNDPLATGELRRLDIVVINVARGNVMRTVEVTSRNAPKADQLAKERRIRDAGGLCIKDRKTGTLKKVPRVSSVVRRK
jgi:RHS repeat-associated protein